MVRDRKVDMNSETPPARQIEAGTEIDHLVLLVSLLAVLVVLPVFEGNSPDRMYLSVGFNLILLLGLYLSRRKRLIFVAVLALVVVEVPLMWTTLFVNTPWLFLTSSILAGGLFAAMSVALVIRVVRRHRAEVQSLFGAVSAYLLLGLAWAVLYWAVDRTFPEAFTFSHRVTVRTAGGSTDATAFSQFVYFSFVTMSTLGYGDISPKLPMAQTLAWLQAVAGQFYLAVAVAWLVNTLPQSSALRGNSPSDED